jgi:Dyp-type peroxidase family
MAIDLTKPLAWKSATHEEQMMLRSLQGNILKGHGRVETVNIFFTIDAGKALAMRRALRSIANFHVTSAQQQLEETKEFQRSGGSGSTFVAVFLANAGYAALGLSAAAPQGEPAFVDGMRNAANMLAVKDPATSTWEAPFRNQIDGMILIGDTVRNRVRLKRDAIAHLLGGGGATIVHEQNGAAIKDHADNGIEHFGYVDGRSQPLLLQEDIERESRDVGIARWDPQFALDTALVKDPGVTDTTDTTSYGSYFIFRKLEQNVQGFKRKELELAAALGLTGEDRERAGALAVGRFEDGTPVTLSDEAVGANPPNDFNYTDDAGSRCPFHAHIRKVNPRGSGPGGSADERKHIMPRRGIPYEDVPRGVHPSDVPESDSLADLDANVKPLLPTGYVGLLFMAYNASLAQQFVFTQAKWANNLGFPASGTGVDPVIGQGAADSDTQTWPKDWDDPASAKVPFAFHGFVHMKGGEYFFAPSITFLKNL